MKQVQTLKGFRDFLPDEMILRQKVIDTCKKVFESFGFIPMETPSVESTATLLEKYGEEADKLVYTFKDKGDRDVGLIYDLTVPTAKVLSLYQSQISLPFKRYQIQRVWRADKPQKGRYREFTQCDIDVFGVNSPYADAEIVAVVYKVLSKLGFKAFTININSRKILFNILEQAGITDLTLQLSILQTIDKLDKKSEEEVKIELKDKNLSSDQIETLFNLIKNTSIDSDEYLVKVVKAAESMGVPLKKEGSAGYRFVPYMVRGLNYYTGPIFETVIDGIKLGSVTAGGRYDNLVSTLGGPSTTGVGTTFGLDRICDAVEELKLLDKEKKITQVLITLFPGSENKSMQLAKDLREEGINCELFLEEKKLDKQLKYADRNNIPYVVIAGPEEIQKGVYKLKNLQTQEQKEVTKDELLTTLKS